MPGQSATVKAIHLLPAGQRQDKRVSARSFWRDLVWHLDFKGKGQDPLKTKVNWEIDLPDGSMLTDPRWERLLEDCRCFVWSLFVDRGDSKPWSATTISDAWHHGMVPLIQWMVEHAYDSFGQLDSTASNEWLEHVHESLLDRYESVTAYPYLTRLQPLAELYRQADVLAQAGVIPPPEAPYDGKSVHAISQQLASKDDGWWPPFPDEIAVRVLSSAMRWVEDYSPDIIELLDRYWKAYHRAPGTHPTGPGTSEASRSMSARRAIESFTFQTLDGECGPWREPVAPTRGVSVRDGERDWDTIQALRTLLADLTAACILVIQGASGMRMSEICALKAGIDMDSGLPAAVTCRLSSNGLSELLWVESYESKIHGTNLEWVVGSRPAGSAYVPPPVQALLILNAIWKPWRDIAGSDDLILGFSVSKGLPKHADALRPAMSRILLDASKNFFLRHGNLGDLPSILGGIDITKYKDGSSVKSHSWRKTFALFVIRTDSRLLPALTLHFKHMSLAMTEEGYLGNDPELLSALESANIRETTQFLLEGARGEMPIAGGMAELVRRHRDSLREIIGDASGDRAYRAMEAYVIEQNLRIWMHDDGNCLIGVQPSGSRCHELAGTNGADTLRPSFPTRAPDVCNQCDCYAVIPRNVTFWRNRLEENKTILAVAEQAGRYKEYAICRERIRQSEGILKRFEDANSAS